MINPILKDTVNPNHSVIAYSLFPSMEVHWAPFFTQMESEDL